MMAATAVDHQLPLEAAAGAWAGWECHFSGLDTDTHPAVQRVPDWHLPPALVEWEVEVWGWEGFCLDRAVVAPPEGTRYVRRLCV